MALLYRHNEIGLGVIKLSGALLGSQADEALDMFRGLVQQGIQQVVVDLADVSFIDSLGLAALAAGALRPGRSPPGRLQRWLPSRSAAAASPLARRRPAARVRRALGGRAGPPGRGQ